MDKAKIRLWLPADRGEAGSGEWGGGVWAGLAFEHQQVTAHRPLFNKKLGE